VGCCGLGCRSHAARGGGVGAEVDRRHVAPVEVRAVDAVLGVVGGPLAGGDAELERRLGGSPRCSLRLLSPFLGKSGAVTRPERASASAFKISPNYARI
jgi:hypothetical protein